MASFKKKNQKLWQQWHVCCPHGNKEPGLGSSCPCEQEGASPSSHLEARATTSISVIPLCPCTTSGQFSVAHVVLATLLPTMEQQDMKSNNNKTTEPEGLCPQTVTPLALLGIREKVRNTLLEMTAHRIHCGLRTSGLNAAR